MPNTTNCLPEHGWFRCPVGGVTKCIPIRRACDNFSDCEDRSDEGGLCGNACDKPSLLFSIFNVRSFCHLGANACNTTKCSHGCNPTPKGAVCSCPIGYKVNGTNCDGKLIYNIKLFDVFANYFCYLDIDECQLFPPMCSQNCINLKGGFQCSCTSGYFLSNDNRTCSANGKCSAFFVR